MSLLAERKRKTRWVINPTKTPLWTQQDSSGLKFGKELMEKMGWSVGKGLGLKEQGIEEPLRLSYKNDTKGMGFKGSDDDWLEHQDEFNMLLSQLSKNNDTAVGENSEMKKPKVKSLELKSKHSRARVHYQKFMRGKDLSNYSENDLACILGINKPKKEKSQSEIITETGGNSEYETSFGVTTINSGSIEDYFKKKYSSDKIKSSNSLKTTTEDLNEGFTDTKFIFSTNENSSDEKKHKKRKYKLEADTAIYETTEKESEELKHKKRRTSKSKADETEKFEVTNIEKSKKKNDKSKKVEINFEEAKMKKKKRLDKNNDLNENKSQISDDIERNHCSPKEESFPAILKEKNMKLKNEEEKKSKQEKHKSVLEMQEIISVSTEPTVENEESGFVKEKKSKKKKKHKSDLEVGETLRIETGDVGNSDPPSEKDEKRSDELGDMIEEKHKINTERRGSVETKNELSPALVDISESNPGVKTAEAEGRSGEGLFNEHRYTSERTLDLIRWADIKEFRGSNLGNVLGYGFKKEYLRSKVGLQ